MPFIMLSISSAVTGSIESVLYNFFFVYPTALSDGILLLIVGLVVTAIFAPFKATRPIGVVGVALIILSVVLMLIGFGVV